MRRATLVAGDRGNPGPSPVWRLRAAPSQGPLPGDVGAPPGGTRAACQELADAWRASAARKARPGIDQRRNGAPEGEPAPSARAPHLR